MLIDQFLPLYDVVERHGIIVNAPVERVYAEVRNLDLSSSRVARALFRLRGISGGRHNTLDSVLKMGFILLAEQPNEEIVLGVVGRFWKPSGGLLRMDRDDFLGYDRPGYAKGAWNFHLSNADRGVSVTTETRVRCLDSRSRRRFLLYWLLVGPFSGLIRMEMLRIIRQNSEERLKS